MALFQNGIGVDISEHHLRFAEVNHSGVPVNLLEVAIKSGYILDDAVIKPDGLHLLAKKVIQKMNLSQSKAEMALLIPESRVFSVNIVIPRLQKETRMPTILSLAQEQIPIPFQEAVLSIRTDSKNKEEEIVDLCAIPAAVQQGYVKAFRQTSPSLAVMEANNAAVYRIFRKFAKSALSQVLEKNIAIVDIGHKWVNITVYNGRGSVILSRSLAIRHVTHDGSGKVKPLSAEQLKKICESLAAVHGYVHGMGQKLPIIILAGVEGKQKTILRACKTVLKKTPILRLMDATDIPNIHPEKIHIFAAAIGAGMRAARAGHYKNDHNFYQI